MPKVIVSIYPAPFDNQIRHDLNSAVYCKGNIFAYEEAKITSVKYDGTCLFPERSLLMGLKELNLQPDMVDTWILPKTKSTNFAGLNLFFSFFLKAYKGKKKNFKDWCKQKIKFVKHHDLHAHSAIGSSNFNNGVYFNIDGGGDKGDTRHSTWGTFNKNKIKEHQNLKGLNSLANFHSFITEFCGFRDENGKVSGFSAYGKVQSDLKLKFNKLLQSNNKGIFFKRLRFKLTEPDLKNFDCNSYDRVKILRGKTSLTNIFKICQGNLPQDVAATAEKVISEKIIFFLKEIKKNFFKDQENIVFSGGLFLNVKINADIDEAKIFKNCFFPMAPNDSGLALGGIFSQRIALKKNLKCKFGLSPYLGPAFKNFEIKKILDIFKLKYSIPKKINKDIAIEVNKKKIVGIFFDRAEYGQRSLGHRSIIADPRNKLSKHKLNQKIKRRDWFMPFAPAILDNKYYDYFEALNPSLYMQKAEKIKSYHSKNIPSAVHKDNTCRIQYVDKKISSKFWNIINEFYKITNLPMLLNTSFNRHGISTICSPRQAVEHLLEGCIDILYIGKYKISFSKNREYKKNNTKLINDKKMIKKNNISWLKKHRRLMQKSAIKKYLSFLKIKTYDK